MFSLENCWKKNKVRAIISPSGYSKSLKDTEVEKVKVDITDLNSLILAFNKAKVVYHLAVLISITFGKEDLLYNIK